MVPSGWAIVCDYYQNIDSPNWVPWSKMVSTPPVASGTVVEGQYGTHGFALFFTNGAQQISPWSVMRACVRTTGRPMTIPLRTRVQA